MNKNIELPNNYKPFPKMILCGNTLIDVKIPFEVEGGVPLLIGSNDEPQIWLNARPPKRDMQWYPIVRKNRSLHESAKIKGLGTEIISVEIQEKTVIRLEQKQPDTIEVVDLDLRPLGLNIYGDKSKLMVGSSQLISNTFNNVYVMIGIGEKQ